MNAVTSRLAPGALFLGVMLCTLAVFWPAILAVKSLLEAGPIDGNLFDESALVRTLSWSILIAIVSAPLGVLAGNALGRLLVGRGGRLAAALSIAPLCLPGYVVFWCWWQAFGPGSSIGAWAIGNDAVVLLREGVLLLALVCWSWPLVAWPIALACVLRSNASSTLAALDGASVPSRLGLLAREQGSALLIGMALVAFVTAGATISFDLAQVASIGFELRALDALGVQPGSLLRFALPSIGVAVLGAGAFLVLFRRSSSRWGSALSLRASFSSPRGGAWVLLLSIVSVTVALPLALAFSGVRSIEPGVYWALYASGTMHTLWGVLLDGLFGALLAGALFVQYAQGGRLLRTIAIVLAAAWIGTALLPAVVITAALTSGYNTELLGSTIYDSGGALLLGHLARAGGVAAAIALFFALGEPRTIAAIRSLDPPRLSAISPRLRATLITSFSVTAVLSLGELVIASRLEVPGQGRIATSLLNAMHYQRPDTVILALGGMVFAGWGLALLVAFLLPRVAGGARLVLLLALIPVIPACSQVAQETDEQRRVPAEVLVGAPGRGPGLFSTPRAIALDAERGRFYVIDKTARVQGFSLDGTFESEWSMPESENGKPVGISVAPDGRVFVPDTHYNRVLVFDSDGTELMRFGSFGTGPGEFVYPTDIAFGEAGLIYVAEYGTNDRIQVFDASGSYLFGFGGIGSGDGEFNRPQSIEFSHDGEELYVADACNHRIVIFDRKGRWLRSIGSPGSGEGELFYPYGITVLPDGTLLVSEFGGDRIQRLDSRTGESLGTWGGAGFERGLLRSPWGVASDGQRIYVLDSGNARVQIGPIEMSSF